MAVASATKDKVEPSQSMEPDSDAVSETSSVVSLTGISTAGDPADRNDQSDSSVYQRKDVETQSAESIKSEEYRLLFHLPPEEVLVQDFNCACQENILLQGHLYLFFHHVCFYSNIFGFETKKTIPFHEVTCVRKAKTAAIFPNAIEILAGGRKHFFASFLSRDEAYRLIVDRWSQHGNSANDLPDRQESKSDNSSQDNAVVFEKFKSFTPPANDLYPMDRNKDVHIPLSNSENDISVLTTLPEVQENGQAEQVPNAEGLPSEEPLIWKLEDVCAPTIPECFAMVVESKFPLAVEEFFSLFFSDGAVDFVETFHRRCGDKEFRCTPWHKHGQFGHARDVSFQHPIKIYFGAKFGHCQEVQKFRVYKNSHLVIETSQQINDVPYGDYFCVEGIWDVEQDDNVENGYCILRVHVNVAFYKRTMWKGKIEQSTIEECREAYSLWINNAHELLKQRNLTKLEGIESHAAKMIQNNDGLKSYTELERPIEKLHDSRTLKRTRLVVSDSKDVNQQIDHSVQEGLNVATSMASLFRESCATFCSYLKSQSHFPLILVIFILMQLSIVVLLTRAPKVNLISQEHYMNGFGSDRAEAIAWLERRVYHLKDEMLMVETRLERMRQEYVTLKAHLQGLEQFKSKS